MINFPINPGTKLCPFQWENASQLLEMIQERECALGCGNTFPPQVDGLIYPYPIVDSVTDNGDGTAMVAVSNVTWTSGQWTGSNHTSECPGTPLRYNLAIFGDGLVQPSDPHQQVVGFIGAQTYNSGANTGTLTIPSAALLNAVTAGFIPSLAYLSGKPYAFIPAGSPTFLDRRWTKPNSPEIWIGQFTPGWSATLDYTSGPPATETFSSVGDAPYFPIQVFFTAVSSSHKIAGTLSLNADGSFSNAVPAYATSGGANTSNLFDPTVWASITFQFNRPTYDPSTGIGQLVQYQNLFSSSPYDNAPGDPIQPPYTVWIADDPKFKLQDALAFDNAGGVGAAFPDPSTFPLSLGHDYTSAPTVTPSGGGGSGAAITAVLGTSTAVVYLLIVTPGLGYTTAPTMSIAGTGFAAGHLVIDGTGAVTSAVLDISSTGFSSEPTVTVDAPPMGGTQAVVRAIIGTETVASYVVTNAGTGYTSVPSFGLSGGGGSGAVAAGTLDGASKLLIRAKVAGNESNGIIYFGRKPNDIAYSIPASPLILDDGQKWIILKSGAKGMPGRPSSVWPLFENEPISLFYGGATEPYVMRTKDDDLSTGGKPSPFASLPAENDEGTGCEDFQFDAFDIDVRYQYDFCNCGQEGYYVNNGFWKTWRAVQVAAIDLVQQYLDPSTLGQDVNTPPSNYTAANAYSAAGFPAGFRRVYRRKVRAITPKTCFQEDSIALGAGGVGLVDPPIITPGGDLQTPAGIVLASSPNGGALNTNSTYCYRVSATNGAGETLASIEQCVTTANTNSAGAWNSSTSYAINDYVTSGGVTYLAIAASTNQVPPNSAYWIVYTGQNHCIVQISWPAQIGAAGYNIYGRTGSGELLMASIAAPTTTFTDDGSITPSGALPSSNTTRNDCNGVGTWIKKGPSTLGQTRDGFGFASDGDALVVGDYYRYVGDTGTDPFPGVTPEIDIFSPVRNRFYRGMYKKQTQLAREAEKTGTVSYSTENFILDTSKHWWTDATGNTGSLRVQGGTPTGGSTTTLIQSSITGQLLCWWNAQRYVNLPGIWGEFILEVYKDGMLAGWTVAADGTASYSAPSAPGNTGTSGTTPTISAIVPGSGLTVIHAIGTAQAIWIDGNHFDPACTGVLTNTDTGQSFPLTFGAVGFGEIALSFDFGFIAANWSLVVTNPGPNPSGVFTFTTHGVYRVPITSGSVTSGTGTLGFTAVDGLTVTSSDAYLIREPSYELNKWQQRMVKITSGGTTVTLPCRYSSDQGLFFDAQTAPFAVGSSYQILEYQTASILRYSTIKPTDPTQGYAEAAPGMYWLEPYRTDSSGNIIKGTDIDPRGSNYGKFSKNLWENAPTPVTSAGFWMAGDDFGPWIMNQIHAILALCVGIIMPSGCDNKSSPTASPDLNFNSATSGPNTGYDGSCSLALTAISYSDAVGAAQSAWSLGSSGVVCPNGQTSGPSTASGCMYSTSSINLSEPPAQRGDPSSSFAPNPAFFYCTFGANLGAQWAYFTVGNLPPCIPGRVDFWASSIFNTDPTVTQTVSNFDGVSVGLLTDEDAWQGAVEGFVYRKWALMDSKSHGTETILYSKKIGGSQPTLAPFGFTPAGYNDGTTDIGWYGELFGGYSVPGKVAIFYPNFQYP